LICGDCTAVPITNFFLTNIPLFLLFKINYSKVVKRKFITPSVF
jgi:hypothetical protein